MTSEKILRISCQTKFHVNFEAITKLMYIYIYSYNITILYMFRALLCSSSGVKLYKYSIWYHHFLWAAVELEVSKSDKSQKIENYSNGSYAYRDN